ncbi:MAG: STAS domain-containing protein [Calditrichaeota bacterium]|nr:STAS domain-containing protein [Calditrichota bacterium]
MNLLVEEVNDIKVLRVKEERVDSTKAPDLKAQLLILTKEEGCKVIIDLSKTKYIDSSGLGALLLGLRQAREAYGEFALIGAQNRVKSLLQIAQLDNVLRNYDNEFEAVESFNNKEKAQTEE